MPSSFDLILDAARKRNAKALKEILANNIPIDALKPATFISAAGALAFENDREGVAFLQNYGANINHIVFGAAMGIHWELVGEMKAKGASSQFINDGIAISGLYKMAEKIKKMQAAAPGVTIDKILAEDDRLQLQSFFHLSKEHLLDLIKRPEVEEKLSEILTLLATYIVYMRYHDVTLESEDVIPATFGMFAFLGDWSYIQNYKEEDINIDMLAKSAAMGGSRDIAEKLREQGAYINMITLAAAWSGNNSYVEELEAQGANRIARIFGAILGQQLVKIDSLHKDELENDEITEAIAHTRNPYYVESFIKQGGSAKTIGSELRAYNSNYFDKENILDFLLFISSSLNRKQILAGFNLDKKDEQNIRAELTKIFTLKYNCKLDVFQAATIFKNMADNNNFFLVLLPKLAKDMGRVGKLGPDNILYISQYFALGLNKQQLLLVQNTLTNRRLKLVINKNIANLSPKLQKSLLEFKKKELRVHNENYHQQCKAQIRFFAHDKSSVKHGVDIDNPAEKVVEAITEADNSYVLDL